MCLAQGPQRSDAGEARTRGPSVSSQTLYHWATALPQKYLNYIVIFIFCYHSERNANSHLDSVNENLRCTFRLKKRSFGALSNQYTYVTDENNT